METTASAIQIDPEVLGGEPVFRGTRVPVQALIDYLGGGQPLTEFLEDFPTVGRELAVQALREAAQTQGCIRWMVVR